MQECYRITDPEIARRSQVDSGVFQPPAQSFNPRLIRFQREIVGDLGRLTAGDSEPEMAGELDHGSHRIRDKLFVALDEHSALRPPEAIVDQDLMDHPLSEQFLERQASLVHQREDHVADVAIRINGQCLPRGERAGKAAMSLVRLEHAPRPPSDLGMDFAPGERRKRVAYASPVR